MTATDVTGLISAVGFPIVLVLFLMWFAIRTAWPWWVTRIERIDERSIQRHSDFIAAINRVGVSNENTNKMLMIIDEKMDSHHAQTIRKLEVIEAGVYHRQPAHSTETSGSATGPLKAK